MRYRATFETHLSITVLLDAKDEESAADTAWQAANAHLQTYGNEALWIQTKDGPLFIRWAVRSGDSPAARAVWDHLAATLPHVTTEEES